MQLSCNSLRFSREQLEQFEQLERQSCHAFICWHLATGFDLGGRFMFTS